MHRIDAQRMDRLVTAISWIYLVTNTVRILFYAPQIRAVFKARDGAAARAPGLSPVRPFPLESSVPMASFYVRGLL